MKILSDIGGTYARFALWDKGKTNQHEKYRAEDFPSLEKALEQYCLDQGLDQKGSLSIATAAYEEGPNWQFVNNNQWIINTQDLKTAGWNVTAILNDFAAATWGILALSDDEMDILHKGQSTKRPRCLTGPGTGLGLGYLFPMNKGHHVQRTHGGHMIATSVTEEQWLIVKTMQSLTLTDGPVVFENLVSGPGLYNIYKVLYHLAGQESKAQGPEDMLDYLDDSYVQKAIRLFHEFLGLHARSAVITAHAYGGLYLTGGVLQRLKAVGAFDAALFKTFFMLPGVESVTKDLEKTPIMMVDGSDLAMKGLVQYEEHH